MSYSENQQVSLLRKKKKKIKVTLILTYIVWNGQLMRASLCRGIHPS